MVEEEISAGQQSGSPEAEEPSEEESAPTPTTEEAPPLEEEPKVAKREKEKRRRRTRPRLTALQAAVLETIRERAQRPRAIQHIIQSAGGALIPRNDIIRCLNQLKRKGLVEKVTKKAWKAK